MKCGIDLGSTLIKVVVPAIGGTKYFSTGSMSKETLIKELKSMGVTHANVTGIGKYDLPFKAARATGDPITHEIKTQVTGAQSLLKSWCYADSCEVPLLLPKDYTLISVGTGASFTCVTGSFGHVNHHRLPYGSAFAGGWLTAIANHVCNNSNTWHSNEVTIRNLDGMAQYALNKKYPTTDLLVKDVMPEVDSSLGELIVASCGKLPPPYPWKDHPVVSLALINSVAIAILDKFLMYHYCQAVPSANVILVGSVAALPSFQQVFRKLALPFSITTWIPPHAEFAGALGALLASDDELTQDYYDTAGMDIIPKQSAIISKKLSMKKERLTNFHFATQ